MTNRLFRASMILGLAVAVAACGLGSKTDKPATSDVKSDSTAAPSSSAASSATTEPTELSSEGGRFSVTFPSGFSKAQESTMPLETAVGKLDMKVYTATKGQGSVFMAAYIDYPENAFAAGTEKMLDGAREGALKNLNGQVDHQEEVTLDGNPGRSMTFTGKTGGMDVYGRVDYYIVKPRLYQILFLSQDKAMVEDAGITEAFGTFKLTK